MPPRLIATAVFLLSLSTAGFAAEYPPRVQRALEGLQKLCTENGGRPGPIDKVPTLVDINGDGRADWVLDRGKMNCEGRDLCPDGFCGVEIYLWNTDGEFRLLLHQIVRSWRSRRIDGSPALELIHPGDFCDRPKQPTCRMIYVFDKQGNMSARRR
jgi:hypothetical protein